MFKGDYADTCPEKIPLVLMGVRVECPACADTGVRTPIGASGILYNFIQLLAKIYSLQFITLLGILRVTPLDTIKGLLVQVFSTRGWFGQR